MKSTTILKTISVLATAMSLTAAPRTVSATRLTQLTDGFEPPNGQWYIDGQGNGTGYVINNPYIARSGSYSALLSTLGSSWRSVGRTVAITGWTSANRGKCSTQFWVNSDSYMYATINVEIIDPVTWTYVKKQHNLVPNSAGWTTVSVDDWVPPRSQVFVRISSGAALDFEPYKQEMVLRVDDMTTQCLFN